MCQPVVTPLPAPPPPPTPSLTGLCCQSRPFSALPPGTEMSSLKQVSTAESHCLLLQTQLLEPWMLRHVPHCYC